MYSIFFRLALAVGPDIHVHFVSIFNFLTPNAGTSVGDDNNDEGQQHICTNDACYCPRLDPVARHSALCEGPGQVAQKTKDDDKEFVVSHCQVCQLSRELSAFLRLIC